MKQRSTGGPPPGAEGATRVLTLFLFLFCSVRLSLSADSHWRTFCCLLREDFLPPPTGGLSAAPYWRTCCRLVLRLLLEVSYWRSCTVLLTAAPYWRTALPGTTILLEVFLLLEVSYWRHRRPRKGGGRFTTSINVICVGTRSSRLPKRRYRVVIDYTGCRLFRGS
jgi:hypothetical protein